MLTRVFNLQPVRQSTRLYSSTSTHFLKEFMSTKEIGPIQSSMERKIKEALNPSILDLVNESHLHAHHSAMKGNTNKETHFKATIVSDGFKEKTLMQRHRMVYKLLEDELRKQGLHALTLNTKTDNELTKD